MWKFNIQDYSAYYRPSNQQIGIENSIEKAGESIAVYKKDKLYWVNNTLKICYFWLLSERKLGIEKYIH